MITSSIFILKGRPMKVFFFIFVFFHNFANGDTQVYKGEAKLKGKLVYRELHTVVLDKGNVRSSETVYTDPRGNVLARLTNDYSKSVNLPEHLMLDTIHKNKHGLRYIKDTPVMFNQDEKDDEETKKINVNDYKGKLVVGGQGLHYYIVSNFEEILKKGNLKLKFVIPGRLDAYDFYLKVLTKSQNKVVFEVEIDNWFLKLFAPRLKMVYDPITKRLISYSGLSNIRTPDKEIMSVDIEYSYE
jgi:hypothetical protein